MNVPTTLPFFNGTRKQAANRDNSPCVIYSPRTQLPPFLIQRPHVANDWVDDILLVDCEGNEADIEDYFNKGSELVIFDTGFYTNGGGTLQNFDTLTTVDRLVTSAIKSTTGAGDAGFRTLNDFTSAIGDRFYLNITITLNSGVAPDVYLAEFTTPQTPESNSVTLVTGINKIILTTTGTGANHQLIFKVASASASNFSIDAIELHETNRPEVHEFTSVDYIQYNGEALIQESPNLVEAWINGGGGADYNTFTTSGSQITSAIELASTAWGKSSAVFPVEVGETYILYIDNMATNSGTTPAMGIYETDFSGTRLSTQLENIFPDGDLVVEFEIETASSTAVLVVRNLGATNFSIDDVKLFKKNDLLPKGLYYVKLTDGTNEWYSEWFSIQDVYENLITGLTNSGYETFVSSGVKILSAINSASTGQASSLTTAYFSVANGEVLIVILFLTLNSGTLPVIGIDEDPGGTISNTPALIEGINEITLTMTKSAEQAKFFILASANVDFSTSDIWVKRQYSSRFTKLQFSDAKDLHGKRNDDQTILYQEGFVQECWMNTILNTPEGNRVDVGDEKDGVFIPEKIVTQYKYKIIDYINRSLFQGLLKLPQHDSLTIIDEVGNEYTPDTGNIEVSMEWSTFDVGTITILFNDGSFVRTENSTDIT